MVSERRVRELAPTWALDDVGKVLLSFTCIVPLGPWKSATQILFISIIFQMKKQAYKRERVYLSLHGY